MEWCDGCGCPHVTCTCVPYDQELELTTDDEWFLHDNGIDFSRLAYGRGYERKGA